RRHRRGPPGGVPRPGQQPRPPRAARRARLARRPGALQQLTGRLSTQLELELALRLAVALVLGAIIGLERESHRHPAGPRTMPMVSVGSCLFTLLGAELGNKNTDPTRIAAQVVT